MSEPFIGQITMFGGNFAPRSWAQCDGQLLAIAQNSALFSILGTTYGGDGRTSFGLPDLRGRSPMHYGSGPGLTTRSLGAKFGAETTTLSIGNLPSHNHTFAPPAVSNAAGDETNPAGAAPAVTPDEDYSTNSPNATMAVGTTGNTGSNQSFNNVHPVQVINFLIALVGIFPSRN